MAGLKHRTSIAYDNIGYFLWITAFQVFRTQEGGTGTIYIDWREQQDTNTESHKYYTNSSHFKTEHRGIQRCRQSIYLRGMWEEISLFPPLDGPYDNLQVLTLGIFVKA